MLHDSFICGMTWYMTLSHVCITDDSLHGRMALMCDTYMTR